jgi:hypothetical protein
VIGCAVRFTGSCIAAALAGLVLGTVTISVVALLVLLAA